MYSMSKNTAQRCLCRIFAFRASLTLQRSGIDDALEIDCSEVIFHIFLKRFHQFWAVILRGASDESVVNFFISAITLSFSLDRLEHCKR